TMRATAARKDEWFLAWLFTAGLLLNVLPVRWFDPLGTIAENLQAWLLILAAVTVKGLITLPRSALAILTLAMVLEYSYVDLALIRMQSIVLPFSHRTEAVL